MLGAGLKSWIRSFFLTDKEKEHWRKEVERQYMTRLLRESYMRGTGFGRGVMVKELIKMSKPQDWFFVILAFLCICGVLFYIYKGVACAY